MKELNKLLNWSHIGERLGLKVNGLRLYKLSKKHFEKIDKIIYEEIPRLWEEFKRSKY